MPTYHVLLEAILAPQESLFIFCAHRPHSGGSGRREQNLSLLSVPTYYCALLGDTKAPHFFMLNNNFEIENREFEKEFKMALVRESGAQRWIV
jgi:hypothetical protein